MENMQDMMKNMQVMMKNIEVIMKYNALIFTDITEATTEPNGAIVCTAPLIAAIFIPTLLNYFL